MNREERRKRERERERERQIPEENTGCSLQKEIKAFVSASVCHTCIGEEGTCKRCTEKRNCSEWYGVEWCQEQHK